MSGTTEPHGVRLVIENPTPQEWADIARDEGAAVGTASGGSTAATGGGTTTAPVVMTLLTGVGLTAADVARYWPANAASAPQSPEGAVIKVVNWQIGGAPYLVDSGGAVAMFATDATGKPVAATSPWGDGYAVNVNGVQSGAGNSYTELVIAQGRFWFVYNGGHTGHWEQWDAPNSGVAAAAMPPFFTSTGAGSTTPNLPAIPAAPKAATPAPGSTGQIVYFGPDVTYKDPAAVLAANAVAPGGSIVATPAAVGQTLAVGISPTIPVLIDGLGRVTGAGTATATWGGGVIIDVGSLADPTAYPHKLGAVVPMIDCIFRGFKVMGAGIHETSAGDTGGFRPGAAGIYNADHCFFTLNQNGVSCGSFNVDMLVSNSILLDNGIGDGHTHNLYDSGGTYRLTLDHVTSIVNPTTANSAYATKLQGGGHAIKCRSPILVAKACYLLGTDGFPLDLPDGTTTVFTVDGSTLVKPAASANHCILGYGEESSANGYAGGTITNSTFQALCPNPFIHTGGGTITISTSTRTGNAVTWNGGGNVVGMP